MAIVDDDIERIRATVSIVEVVQQYVALRKAGRNWVGLCPFHGEKTGSFNVREETGRYKCFGCQAGGDVFRFVQEIEHVDFVAAVEKLASRAGITLRYTSGGEGSDRQRRKKLVAAVEAAVEWYHRQLLESPSARAARDYLRSRGLSGDVARNFRLGWASTEWDGLSKHLRGAGHAEDALRDTGLAYPNSRGGLNDSFRARVMFPIFSDTGDPVAFGGRILPGSEEPAKYKNSPETSIYLKSKTLYGLNWAKNDIVRDDRIVVCEGYTDVIGFHRSGVPLAVATCGTALTEDHVRLMKRFATRVVLAFDADAAGQGAAEKFYEWEKKYGVQVSVARFPDGRDPGDLASSDPEALRLAVEDAKPFLGFRLDRVVAANPLRTPEDRARMAAKALAVISEHPDSNVRKLYAGEIAARVGLPVADLVRQVEQRGRRSAEDPVVVAPVSSTPGTLNEFNAEFVAIALLLQRWDETAPWLIEALFDTEVTRRAFLALGEASVVEGVPLLDAALAVADPEVREALERAAVVDVDVEPSSVAIDLIAAATRRTLANRRTIIEPDDILLDREARQKLEEIDTERLARGAADHLLWWLALRSEAEGGGGDDR